jgi:hypothetical protein
MTQKCNHVTHVNRHPFAINPASGHSQWWKEKGVVLVPVQSCPRPGSRCPWSLFPSPFVIPFSIVVMLSSALSSSSSSSPPISLLSDRSISGGRRSRCPCPYRRCRHPTNLPQYEQLLVAAVAGAVACRRWCGRLRCWVLVRRPLFVVPFCIVGSPYSSFLWLSVPVVPVVPPLSLSVFIDPFS